MTQNPLMGTICGDIIGVPYERPAEKRTKDYNFEAFAKRSRFSDDTVFTLTIASWLLDLTAIAGSIAIATPGWTIPQEWYDRAYAKMPEIFRQILDNFAQMYDL